MTYEIPQQLEYKEKILFGLNFKQLGWACLFLAVTLLVFAKTQFPFAVKAVISTIVCLAGVWFVFFDAPNYISHWATFLKFKISENKEVNKKLEDFIGIKSVKGGIVETKTKKLVFLEITPTNLGIKTQKNQEQIINGFQKFLNSLDFPVQIFISTKTLELNDYLNQLEARVKRNHKKKFKEFRKHLLKTIQEKEIRNRKFYLIITGNENELKIRKELCQERLGTFDLKSKQVSDKEILGVFADFLNYKETESKETKDRKCEGISAVLAPPLFITKSDKLIVNGKLNRIVAAIGYPRFVDKGFLDKIISSNGNFDISIHIEPFDIETMLIRLNQELIKQRTDLYSAQKTGSLSPSLEIQYADTKATLENLQKGDDKLFNVSLYINCKADTEEELELLTKKVETELNSILMIPKRPLFQMTAGYKSMMPVVDNALELRRNLPTKALSAFFPFTSPYLTVEPTGVFLGLNKNKVPIIKDIFKLANANGVVLSSSGSGKSYFSKLLIARQIMDNCAVLVIDPQSEYTALAKEFKGQVVTISRNSQTIINPFDLMGHDYAEKRLALLDLFKVMFEDLSEIQKAVLDKAMNNVYKKKGITMNCKTWKKKPPILSDLEKELNKMGKDAVSFEKPTYRALLNRLSMYTEGVFSFLNRQTKINFKKQFVCFNIGNMPKQVKPVIMFLILEYVYMKMKSDKRRKLLVIDESWSLLGKTEESSYIFEIVKTCRKFNLGLLMITQDVADLLTSRAGQAVLSNSSYTMLFRQKPNAIEQIVRTFDLSPKEEMHLLTAQIGKGILIMENEHQEIEVIASPKEHETITTNPEEVKEEVEQEPEPEKELDLNKPIHKASGLEIEQRNQLINKGYVLSNCVPLGKSKCESFFIKKSENETETHRFLVHAIYDEIKKWTTDVLMFEKENPDIVFVGKNGKKFAIEVETGHNYDKAKDRLAQKAVRNLAEYEDWCFVVTNKMYEYAYTKYGKTFTRNNILGNINSWLPHKGKYIDRGTSHGGKRRNSQVLRLKTKKRGKKSLRGERNEI